MTGRISRPTSDSVPLLLEPIPTDDLDDDITYIPTPAAEPQPQPQPRPPPLSVASHDHLSWPSSISRSFHQLFIKYHTQTYLLTGLGMIAILVVLMTTYWGVTPIHEVITGTNHGSITTTSSPTATTYNNTSMNSQIKRMRVAVILSMWGPPGIDYLSRFLRSMHVSIPPSDLIEKVTLLFLIGMKDDIQDIQKKNITSMWEKAVTTLQTIHPHIILSHYTFNKVNDGKPEPNPVLTRFIAIPDYLRHHRHEYDILLVADARDVIFQADPFELFLQMIEQRKSMNLRPDKHLLGEPLLSAVDHLSPDDPARSDPIAYRHHLLSTQHILFAWESQTIAENSFNSRIVRTAFGPRELNKIQNEMVSCSGTIIGTVDIMMRYCQQVWRHGLTADKRELFGPDQASHMHLLYTDWINLEHQVMLTDYNDGIIHTIGVLAPNQVHVDQFGRIRDGEGHLPAIVHQFDRFPELMRVIEGQYPYHPDGYPITKTLVDTSKGVHGPDPSFNPK